MCWIDDRAARDLVGTLLILRLTPPPAAAFGRYRNAVQTKPATSAICPGVVATDMWKGIDQGFRDEGLTTCENEAFDSFAATILLGRPSRTDDTVGLARFLASSDSDDVTGQSLSVDGGMVFIGYNGENTARLIIAAYLRNMLPGAVASRSTRRNNLARRSRLATTRAWQCSCQHESPGSKLYVP
jgi:hypothetical protein